LKVPRHLSAEWKVPSIEPFNLIDRGSRILGEVEDIHLTLAFDDSHTDGGMAKRVDGVFVTRIRVGLNPSFFKKDLELALYDLSRSHPIFVLG